MPLFVAAAGLACADRAPAPPTLAPGPAVSVPAAAAEAAPRIFFDDFNDGDAAWEGMAGEFELSDAADYVAPHRAFALTFAGAAFWRNYSVTGRVTLESDRHGQVGIVGRGQSEHHYVELVIGRGPEGGKAWWIRQRQEHEWTTLASGPFDYPVGTAVVLALTFKGDRAEASAGPSPEALRPLGATKVHVDMHHSGRAGLVSYGSPARFDDVAVNGDQVLALVDIPNGWGPIALLRDNSSRFNVVKPGAPAKPGGDGWYVTPIHATLRAKDGRVLITGFGRAKSADCSNNTNSRQNGQTFLFNPATLDTIANNGVIQSAPMDEQNLDTEDDVLYCAGHNTMADGRVFFSGGTRFPDRLPDSSPERGLRYSRVFGTNNAFKRISASMNGGQAMTYPGATGNVRGEKWYPSNLLLPDGRVLMFGGFHYSGGGPSGTSKGNRSFELFDPKVWDANNANNPYAVTTQHEEGSADLPPSRGYTNLFYLPKAVPAGNANGLARQIAVSGGPGKVYLYTIEPGPSGSARLHLRGNGSSPNPSSNEDGEGASGVVLSDGRIFYANGGHDGPGSSRMYIYNPYSDSWTQTSTPISRLYGNAVHLPNGEIAVVNGFQGPARSGSEVGAPAGDPGIGIEPGNEMEITDPVGDPRRPVIVNPYTNPPGIFAQPKWPESTHRGYHSFAILMKDGRILIGGGKDQSHATGCEKNEIRIWTPPYLQGNPTRPVISSPTDTGSTFTITAGGNNFTINHTGTLRTDRGVVLMAPGSVTHAFDAGQRYVPLEVVSSGGGSTTVKAPASIEVAQPTDYVLFVISSTGVPSVGVHVRVVPPSACRFAVDGTRTSYVEAEIASRRAGPFSTSPAGDTSGPFVAVASNGGTHTSVPDEGKVLWYDLTVTNGGQFFVWARVSQPSGTGSFWVSLDGNADQTLSLPAAGSGWQWVRVPSAIAISSGPHTLKIKVREPSAQIDKIVFHQSSSFVPSGLGNESLICNGPIAPVDPPTPPAAPSNLVANGGPGQVSLSWTDNAGNESSYELERKRAVDASFALVATLGANTVSHIDGPLSPDDYEYRLRARNSAGPSAYSNVAPASVSPAVGPLPPSNLAVSGTGGNAALTWSDGSSNETGFRVEKKVGTGAFTTIATKTANTTTHTDTTLAGVTSIYRVVATGTPDSAPSNEATAAVNLANADAFVKSGVNASTNYGTLATLEVKNAPSTAPDNSRVTYLRFALTGVGANVTSARLRLFGNAVTSMKDTSIHGVAVTTWIESGTGGITWANAPASNATPDASLIVSTTAGFWEWDLTGYVQAQRSAGATAVSFAVKTVPISNESQTTFQSREAANDPVLTVGSRP